MITSTLRISYITLFIIICQFTRLNAQNDSLVLVNNDMIVGELKELRQGVIIIETDYSDSDFKIEWEKIRTIDTQNEFMITVRTGTRYNGALKSVDTARVAIISATDTLATVLKNDLVYLKEVQGSFLSNLSASLSVGYNYTKADDLSQLSIRSLLGYRARRWEASANYNDVRSSKNNTNSVKRLDASLGYKYYLKKNWYTLAEVSWLSNTEQNINLRTLGRVGLGRYLVQTNSFYWGLQGGASFNNENFSVDGSDVTKNSTEAFLGSELNLYDMGDLSLLTRGILYPSISESGRWRFDFNFDIKYDLPLDFFINLGVTLNFDNQAVDSASQTDYIFQTLIGWSL
ncbi:DUF481 domain-containing protein [Flagellimonas sp. GZD32]|uniref:DUF481 domain-containing protein n=1 Tax=Flagellimonas cixiensis TaxID=3228750 RepID=UPI0035C8BDBB